MCKVGGSTACHQDASLCVGTCCMYADFRLSKVGCRTMVGQATLVHLYTASVP